MPVKKLLSALLFLLVWLQYQIWLGAGGYREWQHLQAQVVAQSQENQSLHNRNQRLGQEVQALKQGGEAVEARARLELGLIKEGETMYQLRQAPLN